MNIEIKKCCENPSVGIISHSAWWNDRNRGGVLITNCLECEHCHLRFEMKDHRLDEAIKGFNDLIKE